jgi:hypothetical protein
MGGVTDEELIAELRRRLGSDTPARKSFDGLLRDAGITRDEPAAEEAA